MSDITNNIPLMSQRNSRKEQGAVNWILPTKKLPHTVVDDEVITRMVNIDLPVMSINDDTMIGNGDQNFLYNSTWVYDTCFDLIGETGSFVNFTDNSPTVSEKLFKSIFYKRPFIVNGDFQNLAMLRSFGFQTFSGLFDESYDTYNNMFDRHEVIVNNITGYKNNYSWLMAKIQNYRGVLEHNYNHLVTKGELEAVMVNILNNAINPY
jgi:hypothetical protein